MKTPTKVALTHLAETMVENGSYIDLRGTGDFINEALKLHKTTGSYVTAQTIRLHEKDLEEMCQAEMLKRSPLNKNIIVPNQFDDDVDSEIDEDEYDVFEDEEWYWASGDMVDHDAIIRRGMELAIKKLEEYSKKEADEIIGEFFDKEEIEKSQSFNQQIGNLVVKPVSTTTPVKNYSMFSEGEDGIRVIRGNYKGLYVREIDHQQWIGCAIGWSKKMLKDNELLGADRKGALTEDDKNVFLDIISGKDV